jgi:hypothetical protein
LKVIVFFNFDAMQTKSGILHRCCTTVSDPWTGDESGEDPSEPLQRIERASRQADPSPSRPDRHEVTVPYRVLSGNGVAGALGCPLPVRS